MTDEGRLFTRMPIPDRSFDAAAVRAYAAITDDFNPIHCDPVYAAATEFGRTIVHGTLVVAPLWSHLADELVAPARHEIRFMRPTPVGATVGYWQRVGAAGGREFAVRLADGTTVASILRHPVD